MSGLLLGSGSALVLAFGPIEIGGVEAGPWRTNRLIGSDQASPLLRTVIARRGLLALRQTETIYFSADMDDAGQALDETCDYRVIFGTAPDARWWSLTLYAEDEFLAVNGDNAHSVSMDGQPFPFSVRVSPGMPSDGESWISSRASGAFNLTLRLYHPASGIIEDPAEAALPRIERLGCEEGS